MPVVCGLIAASGFPQIEESRQGAAVQQGEPDLVINTTCAEAASASRCCTLSDSRPSPDSSRRWRFAHLLLTPKMLTGVPGSRRGGTPRVGEHAPHQIIELCVRTHRSRPSAIGRRSDSSIQLYAWIWTPMVHIGSPRSLLERGERLVTRISSPAVYSGAVICYSCIKQGVECRVEVINTKIPQPGETGAGRQGTAELSCGRRRGRHLARPGASAASAKSCGPTKPGRVLNWHYITYEIASLLPAFCLWPRHVRPRRKQNSNPNRNPHKR